MILSPVAVLCQYNNALALHIIKASVHETTQAQLQSAKPAPIITDGEYKKDSPGIIPGLFPKSSIIITLQLYYSEHSAIIAPSHLDGRRCVLSYLNKRDCFSFLWKGGRYR